jgi:hypothetical protein
MCGQQMLRTCFSLAGLLSAWFAFGAGSVVAQPPCDIRGGIGGDNGHFEPIAQDGSVVTFIHDDVHELTGDVQGVWVEVGFLTLDLATGEGFFMAEGDFLGAVLDSESGTATLRVHGEVTNFFFTDRGHFVITRGRDGISGVHAWGTYDYTVGAGGCYTGFANFDDR